VTDTARVMGETLAIRSEGETLLGDLYGTLPSRRAAVLVHGRHWDASGWRDFAPLFVDRGVPALALNLRGFDGSTGTTEYLPPVPWPPDYVPPATWPPVTDLRAAKAILRERGVSEIALIGVSMGGHAVLWSSFEADIECVVSISAPVVVVPDELSRRISGRKLFVCASEDRSGAAQHALRSFTVASIPKTLLLFGGKEHGPGMFAGPYGAEALAAIVDFVARGGSTG
jgi:pimeloyl-ACP methyl ester carboxylesterase